jgi:hypothetical protein
VSLPLNTALRWARAITRDNELIAHSATGFDKVRMGFVMKRTEARAHMLQRHRLTGKPCPLCGSLVANIFHARGACSNTHLRLLSTTGANAEVHAIARAVRAGVHHEFSTLLVNAGTKLAPNNKQDHTAPYWMLPEAKWGKISARRWPGAAASDTAAGFADAIDLMLVIGWTPGTPEPTGADKKRLKLVPVEHSSTHDLYTRERRSQKRQKYAMLVAALRLEGWTVLLHETTESLAEWYKPGEEARFNDEDGERPDNPPYTVIMGHAGSHSTHSLVAFEALGIVKVKPLLVELSKIAVRHLHYCLSAHVRSSRRAAAATPGSAPAPTAPAARHAAGVG